MSSGERTPSHPPGLPADQPTLRWVRSKIVRQWRWARSEGVSRWIEEDQLNPMRRVGTAVSKWRWRHRHGVSRGDAIPVYLVGVQRSGTNMMARGLELAPQFEVHNENDRAAFQRYQLRSDDVIAGIILRSRHEFVLFKPLCDAHRVDRLLDRVDVPQPGRAIWAYRDVDGRVRSALSKFGDVNLRVLSEIAAGAGMHRWQAQRMSAENIALLRSFDYSSMSPATAAALFWYVRNCLYFELGLNNRDDVFLSSYTSVTTGPTEAMQAIAAFLRFPYQAGLSAHIEVRSNSRKLPVEIDARVRQLSDALTNRLDETARAHLATWRPQ